jgi:SHS2 domain-containing protein
MLDFHLIPHTADIKLRVYGATMSDLFRNALIGMFQSIGPHVAPSTGCTHVGDRLICPTLPARHTIELHAGDREQLIVDFLSDALCLSDIHNQAYLDAQIIEISDTYVKATIHGIEVTGFEVVEIKAVTYHDLYIKQMDDGSWQAEIVLDI